MPEVVGVASNDIEDVIVNAAGKIEVSEILRTRDDKVIGTAAAQMVAHKEFMNHIHGVDHVADGRLAVARYIHDADQETTKGKTERKLTEKGLQYQISLSEERRQKLNAKLIRKSTETEDLLFSMKNKVAVAECMNQFNDVLDAFVTADKEYKRLKQMDEEDDEWFENIYYWCACFGQVDSPELPKTPETTEKMENFIKVSNYLTKLKEALINYIWEKSQFKKR